VTRRTTPKATPTTVVYKRGTTIVPNTLIGDRRLSYGALGLLVDILARPESANQGYRAFLGRGLGQKGLLDAFKELVSAGYRHQIKVRYADGEVVTYTVVAEDAIDPKVAQEFLLETIRQDPDARALPVHARRDLRKRAKQLATDGKPAGGDRASAYHAGGVQAVPMPGAPMPGAPGPGRPMPDAATHKPKEVSKSPSSLRSQDSEELPTSPRKANGGHAPAIDLRDVPTHCEHGVERRRNAAAVLICPACRRDEQRVPGGS
jgi:hypothetical protein